MNARTTDEPVSVSLLALPDSTPTALYGLYEIFAAVGRVWSELTGEPAAAREMDVRIVSPSRTPFACAMGAVISPHASLDETARTDVVVITDLALATDMDPRGRWADVANWVRMQFEGGATVCSVCTGSVLLAEAGLLDGREATSHWSATGVFDAYYPAVKLRPERILSPVGPDHRLVTCGGMASWEDLALYLVARYCGEAEAVRIAKVFVLGDRSEGQLPFAAMARPRRQEDAVISRCLAWLAEHYDEPYPVARMMALSGRAVRAHLQAPLPRRHRLRPGGVRADPAHRGGEAAAGGERRIHGRRRAPGGLRGCRLLPAPVQAPYRRHAVTLPPALPGHGAGLRSRVPSVR